MPGNERQRSNTDHQQRYGGARVSSPAAQAADPDSGYGRQYHTQANAGSSAAAATVPPVAQDQGQSTPRQGNTHLDASIKDKGALPDTTEACYDLAWEIKSGPRRHVQR